MKKLVSYFLQGLLYVVPIGVTVYVLYKAVSVADDLIRSLVGVGVVGRIPGLGLVLTVFLVAFVGWIGGRVITAPVRSIVDNMLRRVPVVNMIYSSIRDLMKAFVGEKRKFDRPVLVCLDDIGVNHRLGFITQEDLGEMGAAGMVAVYVPCAYSFMGDVIVVPAHKVRTLDISPAELMKMVVSGGVSGGA